MISRILLVVACALASLSARAEQPEARETAASVWHAYLAQTAWRQWDCLVQVERFAEPKGTVVLERTLIRMIVDRDNDRMAYFASGQIELLSEEEDGGPALLAPRIRNEAFIVDGPRSARRVFPAPAHQGRDTLDSLLKRFRPPQLDMLAIRPLLSAIGANATEGDRNLRSAIAGGVDSLSFQFLPERGLAVHTRRRVREHSNPGDTATFLLEDYHVTEWDIHRWLPVRLRTRSRGATEEGRWLPVSDSILKEDYRWGDYHDASVPIEIHQERPQTDPGTGEVATWTMNARIHWFSLNRELAADCFDVRLVGDPQHTLDLTDIVLTGAQSLSDGAK